MTLVKAYWDTNKFYIYGICNNGHVYHTLQEIEHGTAKDPENCFELLGTGDQPDHETQQRR